MQQVRGLAVALFITTFFGALWGMVGALALPGAVSLLAGVLVGTVTVVLLLGSARSFHEVTRSSSEAHF